MSNRNDWKFPTNPHSRHPSAEVTRRSAREERVAREIEHWRSTQSRRRDERAGASRRLGAVVKGLALLGVFLLLLAAGATWLLTNAYSERIYPAVVAGDVPVGSLTPQEANERIETRLDDYLESPVTLTFGDTTWQPSAADIGLEVDVDATVARAMAVRQGNPIVNVVQTLLDRQEPSTVPFVMSLDRARLTQYLSDVGEQVDRDIVNPRLDVSGGSVTVEGGGMGYDFLREETQASVLSALRSLDQQPVALQVLSRQGEISAEAVAGAEEAGRRVVSAPVVLEADGRRWEITEEQLADWVRSEPRQDPSGGTGIAVFLDEVQVRNLLDRIASELDREPRNARLQWANGAVQVVSPGEPGRMLDVDQAVQLVQRAALGDERLVALPVQPVQPAVSEANAGSLGITQLIATGDSSFAGSRPNRVSNIRTATQAVTGYVVAPREDFSLREVLGPVTEARGYQPELVGDNQLGVEGPVTGVSQVSTTLFRAALRAGLPILERQAAPYRIQWYERNAQPGTDAVFGSGVADLRFENNTGNHLLVQVLVGEEDMRVELYGGEPSWTVEVSSPELTDVVPPQGDVYWRDPLLDPGRVETYLFAAAGADVSVERVVRRGSEIVLQDRFNSSYEPLQTVLARGVR